MVLACPYGPSMWQPGTHRFALWIYYVVKSQYTCLSVGIVSQGNKTHLHPDIIILRSWPVSPQQQRTESRSSGPSGSFPAAFFFWIWVFEVTLDLYFPTFFVTMETRSFTQSKAEALEVQLELAQMLFPLLALFKLFQLSGKLGKGNGVAYAEYFISGN